MLPVAVTVCCKGCAVLCHPNSRLVGLNSVLNTNGCLICLILKTKCKGLYEITLLCSLLALIARQRLGKHVPMAVKTTTELLAAVLSVWSMFIRPSGFSERKADSFSLKFLVCVYIVICNRQVLWCDDPLLRYLYPRGIKISNPRDVLGFRLHSSVKPYKKTS
jgi:hypothetical protein